MRLPRLVGLTIGVLIVAGVVGVVGLGVGEAIPDRWVADRLHEAVDDGVITDTAQEPTRQGNVSDHFTECIALSVGLGERSDAGLLETLAENPHLGPCDRLVPAVQAYGGAGSLPVGRSYLRYWHGHSALMRPVIVLVGVDGLRMTAFLVLAGSLTMIAAALRRVAGPISALALLGPLVATSDLLELPQTASQTLALAVGVLGALFVLETARRDLGAARIWFASLLAGAAFVYVDILTVVPGVWILGAATVMALARVDGRGTADVATLGIVAGAGWIVGYLGMWSAKWAFSSMVLGIDRVVDDVGDAIDERTSGANDLVDPAFGSAVDANVAQWLDRPLTVPVLVLAAVLVAGAITRAARRGGLRAVSPVVVAAGPAAVPLIWYELASNHSQIHDWFTYRSLPIALGVVLLAAVTPTDGSAPNDRQNDLGPRRSGARV